MGYFLLHLASPYHPISTFASLPPRSDFPSVGLFFGQKVSFVRRTLHDYPTFLLHAYCLIGRWRQEKSDTTTWCIHHTIACCICASADCG